MVRVFASDVIDDFKQRISLDRKRHLATQHRFLCDDGDITLVEACYEFSEIEGNGKDQSSGSVTSDWSDGRCWKELSADSEPNIIRIGQIGA